MIVFAFPPQAAQETDAYWLSGIDYDTGTAAGSLIVVPEGCHVPAGADAPVFCMDAAAEEGTILRKTDHSGGTGSDVWISSRLSGGTLKDRITQAMEASAGRLWLNIAPLCTRFSMPCPTGTGDALTREESLEIQRNCPAFFSPELCCMYCVQIEHAHAHMHLFDTTQTVAEKLRLASALGVPYVFGDIPPDAVIRKTPLP